jgi:tetratricopeptide (TPR) repeat protein
MADNNRSNTPRSSDGRGRGGKPDTRSAGGRGGKPDTRSAGGRGGKPDTRSGASRGGKREDRPARKEEWRRPPGKQSGEQLSRTEDQARYDGPEIPEEITGRELDRSVTAQLKGLPEKLAARVARHLAAAGMLIDEDPQTAYQHTLAARARAARLAVVREACGEAAYAAGEYAEALSELRAAKRINGTTAYLPIMADCERALGRPERALALAKSPAVANFDPATKAEMTIVEAGARRDLGQYDAALRTLENAPLNNKTRATWVVRLRYTYADTLLAAGRPADALEWFHRTEAIDADETTDAATRATTIEKTLDHTCPP